MAKVENIQEWHSIGVPKGELDLDLTLSSGQVFTWHRTSNLDMDMDSECDSVEWGGVIQNRLYSLKQHSNGEVMYQVQPCDSVSFDHQAELINFFSLEADTRLSLLVEEWSQRDEVFKQKANCNGVRLLRVDPLEALITFICSANNNITRISNMAHTLCSTFGQHVATRNGQAYHQFPTLESLCCEECESILRSSGFGYRAKYIHKCAQQVVERGGEKWLQSLKQMKYEGAWRLLKELSGVGSKVADCVCLMGLGHLEAVPIDTHIMQMTARDYRLDVSKSLTDKSYSLIGEHFRSLFGPKAGWAQAILFASEIQRTKSQKRQRRPSKTEKSLKKRKE